jgi:hypothetical protein
MRTIVGSPMEHNFRAMEMRYSAHRKFRRPQKGRAI